jgi:hypothetical protein
MRCEPLKAEAVPTTRAVPLVTTPAEFTARIERLMPKASRSI